MNIHIQTIPHSLQRYDTCGDYWFEKNGDLEVRISSMGNMFFEALVMFHELTELFLCLRRGIPFEDIDKFDINYEKEREKGLHKPDDEPGWDKKAPYHKEHVFAEMKVERPLARALKIAWGKYADAVGKL